MICKPRWSNRVWLLVITWWDSPCSSIGQHGLVLGLNPGTPPWWADTFNHRASEYCEIRAFQEVWGTGWIMLVSQATACRPEWVPGRGLCCQLLVRVLSADCEWRSLSSLSENFTVAHFTLILKLSRSFRMSVVGRLEIAHSCGGTSATIGKSQTKWFLVCQPHRDY